MLETGKAEEAWELGLGVTIVTVEQVPMVAGVTDLNFTVPGRGLNLAAAGFTLCLATNWAAVKPGLRARFEGTGLAVAPRVDDPVEILLAVVDSGDFDASRALGGVPEVALV